MGTGDELSVLVDRLRRDRRRDPYVRRREYRQTTAEVATRCAGLIKAGQATEAVPLLRKAVDRVTTALMYIDDSTGVIGTELDGLLRLYAQACRAAPPNPSSLARWLVTLVCDGPGWPRVRLDEFAPALGPRGLAYLAELVQERQNISEQESWTSRYGVRDLREQLAAVSGDVDRYVAVLAENLTGPHQHRRIAQALREAGRCREAIDWTRQGLADARGGPHTDQLRNLLVDLLTETGDLAAAVEIRRGGFARHPTAGNWQALKQAFAVAGGPLELEWALHVLTQRVADQPAYAGELIDVLLAEQQPEQAWQATLSYFDQLPRQRRADLLQMRQPTHPEQVQEPYRRLIEEQVLDSGDKRRYQKAITLLRRMRDAYRASGDPAGFDQYLADLHDRHKRRPAFLTKLDTAGL